MAQSIETRLRILMAMLAHNNAMLNTIIVELTESRAHRTGENLIKASEEIMKNASEFLKTESETLKILESVDEGEADTLIKGLLS